MKPLKCIAAMSLNRVIGDAGRIPWHLPEDFKFFRRETTGHILVMGRRTFQSIGHPLPDRHTIVLSRSFKRSKDLFGQLELGLMKCGTFEVAARLEKAAAKLAAAGDPRDLFLCGGGQVYASYLPSCSDLYLTVVKREVPGDTFFPAFEAEFSLETQILDAPEFSILHYRRSAAAPGRDNPVAGEVVELGIPKQDE